MTQQVKHRAILSIGAEVFCFPNISNPTGIQSELECHGDVLISFAQNKRALQTMSLAKSFMSSPSALQKLINFLAVLYIVQMTFLLHSFSV